MLVEGRRMRRKQWEMFRLRMQPVLILGRACPEKGPSQAAPAEVSRRCDVMMAHASTDAGAGNSQDQTNAFVGDGTETGYANRHRESPGRVAVRWAGLVGDGAG